MTWFDVRHELDELLDSHLAQAAALLVVQQMREIEDDDRAVDAPTLHRYAPKVAFQVFHEGRLALRSANAPAAPMVEPGERFRSGFRTVQIDGTAWRVFAAHGGERDVQVYVGEQVASRLSILWAVLRSTLWPMAVALPLLALAAWWAVYRGVAPLRRLGRTLAARRPQALQPVVVDRCADGDGADGRGAERPVRAHRRADGVRAPLHRRRGARAAHADRGHPRAGAGGAGRGRRRGAPPRAAATLAGLRPRDAAGRAAADAVAAGGRGRAGGGRGGPGRAGRGASWPRWRRRRSHKGQTIEVDAAATPATVRGDATLLAVLVRNLVDNAMRYSPAGATVKVAVAGDDSRRAADGRGQRSGHVASRTRSGWASASSACSAADRAAAAWAGRSCGASRPCTAPRFASGGRGRSAGSRSWWSGRGW